jgi:hypothetical protein
MAIVIEYPTTAAGEPQRITAESLAKHASALRLQLFGLRTKPITVDELASRTKRLTVNRRPLRIAWDIEHDVQDNKGSSVLGICEVDSEAPDTVMISINGARLVDRPEVFRSTAVHELAHAIFDMPAALGRNTRKTFHARAAKAPPVSGAPVDWTEWRADEFMGAFLVPLPLLARAVAKEAGAMQIPFRWRSGPSGLPVPFLDMEPCAEIGWLVDGLAETFGVTPAFIAVRLKKGGFIVRRSQANERRQ